jgi:transcription-repair coupling factor (superfamily II helicase)
MEFLNEIFKNFNSKKISGLTDELKCLYINYIYNNSKNNVILLTSSLYEATKFFDLLKTYNDNVYFFPMDDFLTSVALAISPELKLKRLETLQRIRENKKCIIVTNLMGFLRYVPTESNLKKLDINIKTTDNINRDKFEQIISDFGYSKTSIVTSSGEYSIRGFVIDIFPYNYETPIRIELFGNNIEKIKTFDAESQLTKEAINSVNILPYTEIKSSENTCLYDLLNTPLVIKIDSDLIYSSYKDLFDQMSSYKTSKKIDKDYKFMYSLDDININDEYDLNDFDKNGFLNVNSSSIPNFNSNYSLLNDFVKNNIGKKYIILSYKNKNLLSIIQEMFGNLINENGKLNINSLNLTNYEINHGFVFNQYAIISQNDIENTEIVHKYHNPVKIGRKIKDFNDIKVGDYVVHSVHGIGIYGGVITLTKNGVLKDYILINYAKNDKVYIPVEKISTIYKYSDADGSVPHINSLNSTTWLKTKNSVKAKIKDISNELLHLYAERKALKSPKYQSFPEEDIFASQFEYEETRDQSRCIYDVLSDLKSEIPMDRLLCGDVGFGKTEVAFRGIFNTIINGYQVAYLCPTTILSKQQYDNALKRFKNFPINIAIVNRFTTEKEFNNIVNKIKLGEIDLVFGTHKLFNNKIEYKNLGLLIVDEEQRFGVTQKEKIKEIAKNVNILTLSATPIPRTLKMAMSGLKDLSILDTAPNDRYPVQTYVIEENDLLIKEAIYKELSRKGQIFYLFNNVSKIENEVNKIAKLVPDARICFAHGQMAKTDLENIMEDFINYKYDVLICTTIIETGIDMPNVNTLIIKDAQNYGLSQLYQLRGRVGRSNKIAYAYLTYSPSKTLNDMAIKRLKAIKEFTELGSGYKIAMRDLSIRGAGDLLGSEQAGFIDSVGIELYTKMIEETMNDIKGIPNEPDDSTNESLINVDTHIDEKYVSDESVRIEIHQLINEIKDYDSLVKIKNEIEDRFGKISESMEIYMYEEWFEKLANKLNILNVIQTENNIEIQFSEEKSNKINGEKLFLESYNICSKFRIRYRLKRISISLPITNLDKHYIYYLVDLLEKIVSDIE